MPSLFPEWRGWSQILTIAGYVYFLLMIPEADCGFGHMSPAKQTLRFVIQTMKSIRKNLGLYEPATTQWITSCSISQKIMVFKTQHISSVTGWLFVMFSGGGIIAASIKCTWWLGHRLISDTIMVSRPQVVKCRGGKQVCNYSRVLATLIPNVGPEISQNFNKEQHDVGLYY